MFIIMIFTIIEYPKPYVQNLCWPPKFVPETLDFVSNRAVYSFSRRFTVCLCEPLIVYLFSSRAVYTLLSHALSSSFSGRKHSPGRKSVADIVCRHFLRPSGHSSWLYLDTVPRVSSVAHTPWRSFPHRHSPGVSPWIALATVVQNALGRKQFPGGSSVAIALLESLPGYLWILSRVSSVAHTFLVILPSQTLSWSPPLDLLG